MHTKRADRCTRRLKISVKSKSASVLCVKQTLALDNFARRCYNLINVAPVALQASVQKVFRRGKIPPPKSLRSLRSCVLDCLVAADVKQAYIGLCSELNLINAAPVALRRGAKGLSAWELKYIEKTLTEKV